LRDVRYALLAGTLMSALAVPQWGFACEDGPFFVAQTINVVQREDPVIVVKREDPKDKNKVKQAQKPPPAKQSSAPPAPKQEQQGQSLQQRLFGIQPSGSQQSGNPPKPRGDYD